jgi:hypothetical protein
VVVILARLFCYNSRVFNTYCSRGGGKLRFGVGKVDIFKEERKKEKVAFSKQS